MESSQIFILISILVLAVIAVFVFFIKKNKKPKLTPLAGLAFGFVLAGIVFGDTRLIGYSLMGTGILLAVIDMIIKLRKKKK